MTSEDAAPLSATYLYLGLANLMFAIARLPPLYAVAVAVWAPQHAIPAGLSLTL